jgi:hypothetical protein
MVVSLGGLLTISFIVEATGQRFLKQMVGALKAVSEPNMVTLRWT